MAKERRGFHEQHFYSSAEVPTAPALGRQKKVVSVMANFDTVGPVSATQRYDRTEKKTVDVSQPKLLKVYNGGMGRVDLHHWMMSQYEVSIRHKKWYWCLVTRVLDNGHGCGEQLATSP